VPPPPVRPGARLGVDVGDVRIGVARSDPHGTLATPVETVPAGPGAVARLVTLADEHQAVEVVVGLPRSLSGREGPAATKVRAFAADLAAALAARSPTAADVARARVRLFDERLTTVSAERTLRERGRRGRARRAVVDQQAAVLILQTALDTERTRRTAPGETVDPADAGDQETT